MPRDTGDEDRPPLRPHLQDGDAASAADRAEPDPHDETTPVRGVPVVGPPSEAPASGKPLTDDAFPAFDESVVPPRPPLPSPAPLPPQVGASDRGRRPGDPLDTADHGAIRDQWRAARDELGSQVAHARGEFEHRVSHAKDHFEQANERIKQRTGRDLIVATLIGVVFGGVLLASLLFFKWLFVPIAVAAALLGVYELGRALRSGGRRVDTAPQLVAGGLLALSGYFAEMWLSWVMLIAAVAFVSVWRMVAQMIAQDGRTYGDVLADVVVGGFMQVYVPFLASLALVLLSREDGEWWVLSFIVVAVAADTCAYAAGLAFGKHPMAPRISPKKTWEGFVGAVAGSLAAGALLAAFLLGLPWWCGLILGAAVLASATLGDLGESMLKRDLGIKDMSSWLPGHGGLLDRLDSILPSTVPALALSFLLAPWMVS
ncbi:phosphatidate cytidylyltransferase [Microbacterium sp.]|uniref:phosphatidate cytidylyltransferase n=1 Tax=Microbacterium sp. TaxID=51671 RepID=UPI0028113C93|nr:phosphatidate cytidylyltransferase [Microbacterium sp.]